MMKILTKQFRVWLTLSLVLMVALPSMAILKGADMKRTVVMLNTELKGQVDNLKNANADFEQRRAEYWKQIRSLMSEERELALVMYSQQEKFLFGTAHAARRVSAMETEFENKAKPMDAWRTEQKQLIHRYEEMLKTLNSIHDYELDDYSKKARTEAVGYANQLITNAKQNVAKIVEDEAHYKKDYDQIEGMDADAQKAFQYIKSQLFVKGSTSFAYYLAHPKFFGEAMEDIATSLTFSYGGEYAGEWCGRMYLILGSGVLALLLGCLITWLVIRYRFSKNEWVAARKGFLIWLGGVTLLTVTMLCLYFFVLERNYFIVVAELLSEYCVLIFVLMMGILFRVKPDHIARTMLLYAPTMVATGVLMLLRMFVVANVTASVFITVMLAICAIWQLILCLSKKSKIVHNVTKVCGWIAFVVFLGNFFAAWNGFHYAAMLIVLLWACMLTVFVFTMEAYQLVKHVDEKYLTNLSPVKRVWITITLRQIVLPLISLALVTMCVYWTSHIFDIEDWVAERFAYDFINIPDVVNVSALRIVGIVLLGMLTNYLVFMLRSILSEIYGEKSKVGAVALIINVGTIVLWGCYVFAVLMLLNINHMGLLAAVSGMTVGIGIALKDTIDCIISGISLMMGRLHVGDVVECDGIRGKVKDIEYRSTLIETSEGSMIVFLNNQLFSKNFKNVTRNHGFEKVAIGVNVGSDCGVEKARELILKAISSVEGLDADRPASVSLDSFNDSSISLTASVWVPVVSKGGTTSAVREAIFNAFHQAGIPTL